MSRTRQTLHAALLALLNEKDFEAITVKELVTRAGIARATFYLHFKSKEEVLLDYTDELFESFYLMTQEAFSHPESIDAQTATKMFEVFLSARHASNLLVQTSVQQVLLGRFRGYLSRLVGHMLQAPEARPIPSEVLPFMIEFWAGGSLRMIARWVENDYQPAPEIMGEIYAELTVSGMKKLLLVQPSQ